MRYFLVALVLLSAVARPALAESCDLSRLVGYTLVWDKIIDSYIEEGKRVQGFDGCDRDRVLVFADGTGVRCVETFLHSATQPHGFLFARSKTDLMLCVDGDLYKVAPAD